jgi:hypothetical protein
VIRTHGTQIYADGQRVSGADLAAVSGKYFWRRPSAASRRQSQAAGPPGSLPDAGHAHF